MVSGELFLGSATCRGSNQRSPISTSETHRSGYLTVAHVAAAASRLRLFGAAFGMPRSPSSSSPSQRLSLVSSHINNNTLHSSHTTSSLAATTGNTLLPATQSRTLSTMSAQPEHPTLLIPGPIEFDDAVLQSMSHYRYAPSRTPPFSSSRTYSTYLTCTHTTTVVYGLLSNMHIVRAMSAPVSSPPLAKRCLCSGSSSKRPIPPRSRSSSPGPAHSAGT